MATYKFNLSKDQPIEPAATPAKESATTRKRKMTGVEYLGAKTATGLVSGIENVWDFAAGGIADLFGADEWAEKQVSTDWFGDWYGRADTLFDANNGWKIAGDVTGAIGQMAPSILLALALQAIPAVGNASGAALAATSVSSAIGNTLLAATPAIASSMTMGLSAAGGATKEAYSQTGNLSGKEWGYGALVGATEAAIETASAGLAKGSGKIVSGAYNLLSKQAAKTATTTLGKTTMKSMFSAAMKAGKSIAGDFAWEAMEEGVAEILAPMYAQLTYNPNAQNATAQEVAYAALVGGLTGLVMSGANGAISTSWNHAKALSLGNKLVSTNGVQGTLRNAQLIAQYQAENDTDIEAFKAVAKGYAELAADIGSSTELTAGQKMRLGELSRNISAAAFSTSIYRSAQAYTDNAETLSARINSLGLTGIDGKPVTVGVEDILRGIDKSDLETENGRRRYQKSIQRAISENPILSYLAINDAVGHMLTDSTMLAAEMATGDAPITRSNLNALIERGSQQNIDAVASLFNVTSDELVRMSPSELDELGMYHAFTAEGQKTYNVNRMYQEAIRNKDGLRVSSATTVRAAMKDGMFRINRGNADVAVIKDGDKFYLYDYNSKNRSRALTAQEANAVIKDLIGEGVSTETARTKTKYQEETESIEKFARDNIKGYKNLTPAVKEYVRMTIRDARAHGKSDQISALIAKVSMRTGLPILFDGDVTGSSNAIYRSSTIYLNPSLEDSKVYTMLLAHEFGHAIKDLTIAGDKFFDRIAEMIFDENGKVKSTIITQEEVDDLKKRYTEFELSRGRTEEKAAEIAKEEIVTAYMEKVVRSKKTWEYVLGEKPSFKDKVLSFFRKAEADYATEPRMNAEARKFLKYYKKMFAELEAASIDQSKRKPKGDDSSIRNSISSFAKAAGISAERNPETGRIEFRDKDGNLLSADDITAEHAKDSGLGLMISLAVENNNITKAEAKKQYEGIADLLRLILRTQDPDLVWQFAGATMFSSVKANSDAQYTTTIDFSTVCRKTQEMIDEMTITMKKIGRGLTRSEVVELQRRTIEEGGTVNCPVCYVFSRWVGIGGVLDNIRQMQDKYEKYNTEELNAALRETFNRMTSTVKELAKKNGKRNTTVITQLLSEKSERLTTIISELEGLKATKAKKTSDGHSIAETVKKMEAELAELQIEVDVLSEYSWLKTVRLKKNYKPVPVDVLYDLSDPAEFAEKYKDSWKYRTTRGPGAGKAILPYSDARLGDIISGAKVKAITDEEGTEIVTRNKTWEEIGSEFTKAQRESIKRALIKQLAQNIIGGQRMQSTSDFRYDYALDYVLSFFEMQAIGSNIQTYTKMVEFADFVASVGGDVNLSLMPLDAGYKDGKLIFSAVTGMNFEAAKEARAKHDSVQTILVGINDEHIRLALLDSEETLGAYVDFVIPYHASGASQDLIRELVTNLGEKYNKKNYVDYSKLQSDKSWEDSKLTDEILELRAIRQYILTGKVSTKNPDTGKTSSKDAPIPPRFLEVIQQMNDKRVDISKKSFAVLRAIEKKALAGDPKAIETYKSWSAGVLYDTYVRLRQGDYTADGKKVQMRARLSSSQAKAIMPHEYWDRTSTRKNAYINGFIFRSYCYSLGMTPRFSGMTIKDVFFGDFTNETGYWKTLIDRPMYDLEGRYRDQQKCRVTNFQTEMVLPSWADRVYPKYKVQEPSYQRAMRIANQFADEIIERERGGIDEVVVEERHSLGDSVGEYRYRSAMRDVGYHAGDLGKSEHYGMQGYYRDTGHFGTGTYFVGNEAELSGYEEQRPRRVVDFSKYNLYKIRNSKKGKEIHAALRVLDGGITEQWIQLAIDNEYQPFSSTEAYQIRKNKFGDKSYTTEAQIYGYTELAKRNGIELKTIEEFAKEEGYKIGDEYLDSSYAEYVQEAVEKAAEEQKKAYRRFADAYFTLWLTFGTDATKAGLWKVLAYQKKMGDPSKHLGTGKKPDSLATVFMKSLGYEGIDVRGTDLDNTTYGSVIYDLKEGTDLTEMWRSRQSKGSTTRTAATDDTERFSLKIGDEVVSSTGKYRFETDSETMLRDIRDQNSIERFLPAGISKEFAKAIDNYGHFARPRLYRGMEAAELDYIIENGFIKSNSSYNFTFQADQTRFSSDIRTAFAYATSFAPQQIAEKFFEQGLPAYIVEVGNYADLNFVNEDKQESYTYKEIPKKYITRIIELTVDPETRKITARDIEIPGMNKAKGELIHGEPILLRDSVTGTVLFAAQDADGYENGKYISEKNTSFIFDYDQVAEGGNAFSQMVGISGKESNLVPLATADETERHSLGDTATEEATRLIDHMRSVSKANKGWKVTDLFNYVKEHHSLNFIDRIFNKDKTVKSDLVEFLNGISDEHTIRLFGRYMELGYGEKDSGYSFSQGKWIYPYRGAVRTFQNAVKKRLNDLRTAKVGGTDLGVKNGEISLEETKSLFYRLNSDSDMGALAKKVFATAERLGVNIRFANQLFSTKRRLIGDAWGDMLELKTSYFNDTAVSDQQKADTILHEMIHICTVYIMDESGGFAGDFRYGADPDYEKLANAVTRLNRIYLEIKNDPDFQDQYGITNAKEMVAELSNPKFVELMKKKSLWQDILDWIAELFGFSRGTTAYDNAMACLDYILDHPDVYRYKNHALAARRQARQEGSNFGYTETDDGTRYSLPADEQSARMLAAQNARLRKRNAQLTEENRESRAFANNLLAVQEKAKALIDKKNGAFLRAFEITSKEMASHPIYKFAQSILRSGKLVNPQSIREHAREVVLWYASGQTIEILGKSTQSSFGLWQQDIVDKLKNIIGKETQNGNATSVPLTAKQLGELAKVLAYFGKISENLTKRHRRGKVIELADESVRLKGIIDQNQELGIKPLRMGGYLRGNLDPASVARKLDGYVSGGFFTDTYEDMRRGVIDSGVAHMRMLDAYEAFLKDNKRYLDTARTSKVTVKVGKTEYSLTRMELISLYLTTKRQQAFKGLVENGFVIRRPMDKRIVEKVDRHKDYEIYEVQGLVPGKFEGTKEELAKIVGDFSKSLESLLSESDKKYVAILENIYNVQCKELKKKTDLARFGYSNVIAGFYYPVRRYLVRSIQGETTIQQELEFVGSASFNQDTVKGASSQLLIEDADNLMHRHSEAVCNYAYLAETLDTYNRLLTINAMNVSTKVDGVVRKKAEVVRSGKPISLRAKIEETMGASVLEYFNSLWVAAQGGTYIKEGEGAKVFNALRGAYAVSALAGNPKVLVTQTTSLIAACNLIDADCIAKTMFRSGKGVDEYCPLAELRNHDSEAVLAMTNAEITSTIGRVQGITMRLGNSLMKPIAGMDRLVITRLFAACQEQIAKDNDGDEYKVGTKKNLQEAGKLLEKVILETQQNALPTERSSWMRDGNVFTKSITMFSADAMKSFGRLFDAANEFNALGKRLKANPDDADLVAQRKRAGKKAAKAGGVIVAQAVYMTLISQAFKYLYAKDDDDRKLGWAMVLDTIGGLFSGLPLVRDIVDFFINKYSIDNFAFETLNGVLEGITNLLDSCEKVIKGEDNGEFMNKTVKNISFMVGTAMGLPTRNIYNLLNGITRRIGGKDVAYRIDSLFSQQSYANDLEEAIKADDIDLANTIVDVALEKYLGQDVDDTVAEEIRRANRSYKFFPASPYTSEAFKELSAAEKEQFKDVYSGSISDVKSFIRSKKYYKLSEEERGKIIDYIFDTYYDAAMVSVARKSVSKSEMKKVVASRYIDLVVLAEVDTTTGNKQERAKAVNSLSVSDEEKLFIYALKYKLTDKNEQKLLRSYINNLAATNEEKALILEFCQLND